MWRSDRKTRATLALMSFASLVAMAPVNAQGEAVRDRPEHRPAEGVRQSPHQEAPRPQSAAYPARPQGSYARPRQTLNERGQSPAHSQMAQHPMIVGVSGASHFSGSGRVQIVSRTFAGGQVHVIRYGTAVNGTVERTIRPGLVSRTFVSGGHVLYAHVYQSHVWHQFGRAFAYETFVPAVRFPGIYYGWALAAWPRPVSYAWGWQAQPWYPIYGLQFTPYPVYTSPDLWMTDYIIAQNMQTAYQSQTVAPGSVPAQADAPATPTSDSSFAPANAQSEDAPLAAPPAAQSTPATDSPETLPPAITPEVKAQLNAQIKVQLQEQQAAAAMPVSLTTQSTPPALRPNHVFFEVVQPLDVPSGTANGHCSLGPNDYIKRTDTMSTEDWTIPVVVELSRPSDCPAGLATRIGLNDLNAMENEQEAQVVAAMQAASKSMGANGPPSGPGAHPTLIADGSAAPDPMALDAIRQTQ